MHDVACEFVHPVVRSKDVQKQLVRMSLKDKKVIEFNTLDKLLSEGLGLPIPFSTIQVIPPESVGSVHLKFGML